MFSKWKFVQASFPLVWKKKTFLSLFFRFVLASRSKFNNIENCGAMKVDVNICFGALCALLAGSTAAGYSTDKFE